MRFENKYQFVFTLGRGPEKLKVPALSRVPYARLWPLVKKTWEVRGGAQVFFLPRVDKIVEQSDLDIIGKMESSDIDCVKITERSDIRLR